MKQRKPDYIEVSPGHVIATKGIMSIKQCMNGSIEVRYITGYSENLKEISMTEVLNLLGRNPNLKGGTDSQPPASRG